MHIPDGYLSPATCATLYTGSAPFWWVALRRMQRGLNTQMVPLLSVFAAFSFIIMMFNLPLPGGTTGHAVGVGIAAIVLGPWASILAISIALVIQALLFGDGGITAIGANCFNMAILGSLSAYGIYRLLAGSASIESPRRVMAGAIAGYVAINLSALAAAVELGIQPLLYRDASGAALYAPYPLQIAIPAMMAGHLTVAGLAEMLVSGGVVGYLQRMEPNLLRATAPHPARKRTKNVDGERPNLCGSRSPCWRSSLRWAFSQPVRRGANGRRAIFCIPMPGSKSRTPLRGKRRQRSLRPASNGWRPCGPLHFRVTLRHFLRTPDSVTCSRQ
jgi:cobalamin biosynthesis protein CbiM